MLYISSSLLFSPVTAIDTLSIPLSTTMQVGHLTLTQTFRHFWFVAKLSKNEIANVSEQKGCYNNIIKNVYPRRCLIVHLSAFKLTIMS